MVEDTDKIKQHIEQERENLGRNLDEIEDRFKEATDLRNYFEKNTGWILGAAVAGGFLVSLALGRPSPDSRSATVAWQPNAKEKAVTMPGHSTGFVSQHLHQVSDTVNDIVDGLVGVFSEKLQTVVAEAVPGFREQYENVKRRDPASVPEWRSPVGR